MPGRHRPIVPPQLFELIARRGSPEDRDTALRTLSIDHSIRTARVENACLAVPLRRLVTQPGGQPHRTIFDAEHREDVHATTVVRVEDGPPAEDPSANEAYDGLGETYRFYWEVMTRDSIDDVGLPLLGEVHFGEGYDNAFWDGERMMFGDGDGRLFTGFTRAIDVIAHELTHGVIERTLNLRYLGQSGALNESISDVFGSLVKQHRLGQTADEADWLVGAGILGPALHGAALRSLQAPGTAFDGDGQPARMSDYVWTSSDNGGVHLNSGIPNHAFYLVATALGGHAWERAGRIWYHVLATRAVPPDARFHTFALATVRAAAALYGRGSPPVGAVLEAWAQVGVLRSAEAPSPVVPP